VANPESGLEDSRQYAGARMEPLEWTLQRKPGPQSALRKTAKDAKKTGGLGTGG